ncbi:MAG: fumarylacetoacetate hydrolase family protein [Pirellulaceae bacterium]|nr:fumarylacetoacetate hydrolase family protein [Pirellulaceae bacterium]
MVRFITYSRKGDDTKTPHFAAKRGDKYIPLDGSATPWSSLKDLLKEGKEGLALAKNILTEGSEVLSSQDIVILPPIPNPQKVLCVGLNYADHAAETGAKIPAEPLIFNKLPTTVAAHHDKVVLPKVSQKVDFEGELVVVIGKEGKNIAVEKALNHVAGYCCGHDVSARDWQKEKPGEQWLLGKSFDTFAPYGPELVTADEIRNPHDLGVQLRINGEVMQNSRTREFIFNIDYLIAYISQVCTLAVGDLIFTGTPPGVGVARNPPRFLQEGDLVEVEIETIGILKNEFVYEK